MIWVKVKRVAHSGFVNFWRNGVVSLASVLVTTVALFVIGSVVLGGVIMRASLNQIKDKVDVNVYFKPETAESDILELQRSLEALPEVQEVTYVSREETLARFKETQADNTGVNQALEELGYNPFGARLGVKARDPSQYEAIGVFLDKRIEQDGAESIISDIDDNKNKQVIDRIARFISAADKLGLAVTILFIFMAVLVTFNTIRIVIYSSREEIGVMRLVGASDNYVRGPFVVEGVMSGFISAIAAIAIFYPATLWVSDSTQNFFGGVDLYRYYLSNFWELFGILLLSGVLMGALSSYLAVRRYLKV